jgi:hypothetical protein
VLAVCDTAATDNTNFELICHFDVSPFLFYNIVEFIISYKMIFVKTGENKIKKFA